MADVLETRCAVCSISDGTVINIIMASPSDPAPDGCNLVELMNGMNCDIGWTWDGLFTFTPPTELTDGN